MESIRCFFVLSFAAFICHTANGQTGVFTEFYLGFSDMDRTKLDNRNIQIGLYKTIKNKITLRTGLSLLDSKDGENFPVEGAVIFDGRPATVIGKRLYHSYTIRSNSLFAGFEIFKNKWIIGVDLHYVQASIKNGSFVVRDNPFFTNTDELLYFDASYEKVYFPKINLAVAYKLLEGDRGSLSMVFNLQYDLLEPRNKLKTSNYNPHFDSFAQTLEIEQSEIVEFKESGDLIYNQENALFGFRVNYHLK